MKKFTTGFPFAGGEEQLKVEVRCKNRQQLTQNRLKKNIQDFLIKNHLKVNLHCTFFYLCSYKPIE